jgi:phytoene dehydrogenase-like protein
MKLLPYWVDSAPPLPSYAVDPLPERADVLIVGGGYTGLSTALYLARKGAQVTLIEAETLGWGASSRNGGHCNAGITISPGEAVKRYGLEAARRLYQVSLDAVDTVEELCSTRPARVCIPASMCAAWPGRPPRLARRCTRTPAG